MKNKSARKKLRRTKQNFGQPQGQHHQNQKKQAIEKLYLYGIHTVREAMANSDRRKHKLLVTKNASLRLEKHIAKFGDQFEVFEANPHDLDGLVGRDAVHQGALLHCEPLATKTLSDIAPGASILILDQISDPHNVGAIMRSCVAMGVEAIITTNRSSAPQTGVLAKSASGALDLIDIIEVSNLSKAITNLNAQGYQTLGLDSEGPEILENSIDEKTPYALVLGAEGRGLRQKTRETCTKLARLDMPGKIKSLNVSNAAALALYVIGLKMADK